MTSCGIAILDFCSTSSRSRFQQNKQNVIEPGSGVSSPLNSTDSLSGDNPEKSELAAMLLRSYKVHELMTWNLADEGTCRSSASTVWQHHVREFNSHSRLYERWNLISDVVTDISNYTVLHKAHLFSVPFNIKLCVPRWKIWLPTYIQLVWDQV